MLPHGLLPAACRLSLFAVLHACMHPWALYQSRACVVADAMGPETRSAIAELCSLCAPGTVFVSTRHPLGPPSTLARLGWRALGTEWFAFERLEDETVHVFLKE